jgi:hypothetical protein
MRESCGRWTVGLVILGAMLSGCAGDRSSTQAREAQIPIASIQAIAGKWAAVVERTARREDWVELLINEDSSFQYTSARTIGMLEGKGTLTLREGQGISESGRGRATYRLYDRGGRQVLRVEVVETNGLRYEAEFTR